MAARYWVGGNATWDATAGTKWALTSGGAGGQAVPTSADDVFLDASSGANTVTISANANCKSLTCTGFTGTLTGSSSLNIAGNISLGSGMSLTYSGLLSITATSTIVSNGKTFPCNLTISASTITTLTDAAIVTGNVTFGNSHTLNGSTLTVGGSLTSSVSLVGTATNIILNGTGTWTGTLGNSLEINTSGTITFGATNGIICNTTTFKYTSGTVVTTGNTFSAGLSLSGTNILTVNCSAITFNNFIQGGKIILAANLNVSGNYTLQFNVDITGAFNLNIGGNLTMTGSHQNVSTTTIILNGTGTWSGSGVVKNNLTINTAGTITISGTVTYNTGILTYTTGTIVKTGSTLNITATTTIATNGMSWNAITFSGGNAIYTLTNNLTADGTVTFNGTTAQTINGSTLICKGNLTSTTASVFVTGTTNISMQGTSTIVGSNGGYALNIDINTAGTISFTNILYWKSGTFSYTAGTINAGTSTINHFSAGAFVLSLGSQTAYNVTLLSGASIGSALNCSGTLIIVGTSLNTYAVNCSGSLSITVASSGTSTINMTGTGTLSCSGTAATLNNTLNINTSGTITLGVIFSYYGKTWTLVSGTLVKGGTVYCMATTTTTVFDLGNTNIGNLQISGAVQTLTLLSNLSVDNFAPGTNPTINGNNLNINGSISTISNTILNGTTVLNLVGTGTWNWNSTTSQGISNIININTSGTITLGTYVCLYLGCTLNYVTGTIVNTSSTLYINGATPVTINASGMNFNDVIINSGTVSLSSVLNVLGTLSTPANATFTGTSGFITNNLSIVTVGRTLTLKAGLTYTVNSNLTLTGSTGSKITITSNTIGSYTYLILNPSATQAVTNTNATWVDSSGGKTIWSSAGTLTSAINWMIGTGASGMYKFFFG